MAVTAFDAIANSMREPHASTFSPSRIAKALALNVGDLAQDAGVHRNTLTMHPESPRVQQYLRDLVRVMSAAVALGGTDSDIIFWVMNQPLRPFGARTAYDLVRMGRVDDVVGYIESIESGFVG